MRQNAVYLLQSTPEDCGCAAVQPHCALHALEQTAVFTKGFKCLQHNLSLRTHVYRPELVQVSLQQAGACLLPEADQLSSASANQQGAYQMRHVRNLPARRSKLKTSTCSTCTLSRLHSGSD